MSLFKCVSVVSIPCNFIIQCNNLRKVQTTLDDGRIQPKHIATCYLLTRRIIYVGCGFCVSIYWIHVRRCLQLLITRLITSHKPATASGMTLLRNCFDEHLFQTPTADCSWRTPHLDLFWWTAITTCSSRLPCSDCHDNQSSALHIVSVIHCCLVRCQDMCASTDRC
jgi:hypothetical protein